ncbi:MAG TPA: hypothetical protein VK974_04885 [Methylophilaceae bacterium]|nr:hypothetical protein [Methylophilaceae bacterium]
MINNLIVDSASANFEITQGGRVYKFQVPNELLEEIAHYDAEEASEALDYGAVFEDYVEKFHAVALDLIKHGPEEGYIIIITPENFYA